ncbi:MAG: HYR domain-containing protein [Bacteroidetes bacterium]|nr:HYR domain-containing protein [Bacteroidota bacterium]
MKKMYDQISAGKLISALLFCFLFSAGNICKAQLLQWNTFGNVGTETTEPSVFNDVNIAGSVNLTIGTITPATNANRFGGSGWFDTGNTVAGNTLAEAIAGNDYIQFVVTPNAGFSFTATSLVFTWDRSTTGPSSVTLRSSADGFVSDLGTVTGMISGGAATTTPRTITISTLSNISATTTFRLYGYAATATAGTGGFDNSTNVVDVQLNGTTAAILTPILSAGAMSASFGNVCINTTAGPESFSLSGNNLDGSALNINALSGYSYCLTSGGTYLTTIAVPYTAPTLSSTTIFVKFNPTSAISYNGSIPVNGGGTSTTTAVFGAGINTLPTTTSGAAGPIGSVTATVAGTVSSPGCGTLTAYGIEYSTTSGFPNGSGTPVASTNLAGINFTSSLTGLSLSTVYYYHSYATNSNAVTAYGTQGTFTTTIDIPNATAATNVANHSFDANWDPVTGATGYRLDVATTNTFYAAATTPVVEWNFPNAVDDNIADGGIAFNTSKTLNLFGCLAAVSYVPTSGSTTSAATTASASGGWASGSGADYWEVSMVTAGYYNLKVSSAQRSSNTGPKDFKLQYKIGAGGTYTDVPGGTTSVGNNWTSGVLTSVSLPAACENKISVFLRWIMTTNTAVNLAAVATTGTSAIDNISVIGNAGTFVSGYNNLSVAGLTQPVSGLAANATYYYRVRATGASSTSDNSNVITVTTTYTPAAINACPLDIVQCDNNIATWTDPTATGDPAATVICSPLSGSTFSLGTTSVTCTANNGCGSPSSCSFNVTINESPAFTTCPGTQNANTTGACTAVVSYTTISTGFPAPTITYTFSGATTGNGNGDGSSSTFNVGTTVVTVTATNSCLPAITCSFNVVVADVENPVITCPPTANIQTDLGQCSSSALIGTATATDNCSGVVILGPFPAAPYPVGATTVTWFAQDANGNSAQCSQIINVADAEPPVITCPPTANIQTDLGQCSSSALIGTATATDNCSGVVILGPFPAAPYPVGATTVTWFAQDANGNSAQCNQIINVTDAENPSITCPGPETIINDLGACTGTRIPCPPNCPGLFVNDNCGIYGTSTNHPSPTYPEGTTAVIYTVTDIHGNTNTCAQNITVVVNHATAATGISTNASYNQICYPGALSLTAIGGSLGTAGGQWVWYDGGCGSGASIGIGASITITPSIGLHNYFVRAEEACGNTACKSVAINVINAPPSGTIHYTASIADGCVAAPAATFSVNAVANSTFYNWSSSQAGVRFNGNPSPFQTTVPTVNVTFVSLPAAGASGWSICVFGGNACGNTNTICTWVRATVSMPNSITGSVIGCTGTSGNAYSSSTVAGAASYQWSSTGGIVVTGNGAQAVTVAFPGGFVSGTLSVCGQTACGYQGPNRTITITASPVIPGTISGPSYPCPNSSSSYSIAAVPGAANYTWTTSVPGAIVTGTGTSCSIAFPATIPAGSTVSVVANSSCPTSSPTRSKGISTGLPGVPFAITGPASGQCGQTGVSYSISPVFGATGYNWTASCGITVGPTNLSGLTIDWPASFTTCTLSVTATNACGTGIARTLVVFGAPAIPASITGNAAPCASSVEGYAASSLGATSYNWTVPAGALILGPANGASISVLWGATSGNITVTATNACGTSGIRSLPCVISCRQSQISASASGLNAQVYPNPATEKATVKFTATTAVQYQLNMTDVLGQNVLSTKGTGTEGINMVDLDLNNLAKGVYMLNIMSGDNNEQLRVVVE